MIPLRDDVPSRRVPLVVYALTAANVLAFGLQLMSEDGLAGSWGLRPAVFLGALRGLETVSAELARGGARFVVLLPVETTDAFASLFTSLFLHGGILHLGFNMLFLWIFGDNVEDELGHARFFFFYVGCGVLANFAHIATNAESGIPTIGASGAVAGVLGAYFLRFPRARVLTLIPIFFILQVVELPALFFLGLWFAVEVLKAITNTGGNVAVWAHAGGFVAGIVILALMKKRPRPRKRPPIRDVPYEFT